jgi:hypothetical protein
MVLTQSLHINAGGHDHIKMRLFPQIYIDNSERLNIMVEWLTLRIREVQGSNLGLETGYPE